MKTMIYTVLVPLLLAVLLSSGFARTAKACQSELQNTESTESENLFEAPTLVLSNDRPINANGQIQEISPAILDIDGDGKNELAVGGLSGEIVVFSDGADKRTGDPVWTNRRKFKVEGKTFELPNW